jgi:hypothetical protein
VSVPPERSAELTKGYVLVPESTWVGLRGRTDMQPLLAVKLERFPLVLADSAALRRRCTEAPPTTLADGISQP